LDMVELLLQTKSWCAFEAFIFFSWERQSLCVYPNCCFLLFNLPSLELHKIHHETLCNALMLIRNAQDLCTALTGECAQDVWLQQ
jgi:hypothetical protein